MIDGRGDTLNAGATSLEPAPPVLPRVWVALMRKAWLETRARFVVGAVVVAVVCAFMVFVRPRMIVQWPLDKVLHPEWRDPWWWDRVHTDYPFFLWHYLYRDLLQKAFMVFAVLLGVGGLVREAAAGTAGYTLALPVTRRLQLATRSVVAAAEVAALGVIAALTILISSMIVGVSYSPTHAFFHCGLIAFGALTLLAGSLCISSVVEGEYAPALVGLAAVGTFNYVMAPYIDGGTPQAVVALLNIVQVMSGDVGASAADVPWVGMLVSASVGAGLLAFAFLRSERRDY